MIISPSVSDVNAYQNNYAIIENKQE